MSSTRKIFLFIALPLLLILGIFAFYLSANSGSFSEQTANSKNVPAACNPIVLKSPTDVSKATGVLYPGQIRGGDYKPHGGFRFDGLKNDDIKVVAPYDASLFAASRYIEQGEVQYLLDFMTDCGSNFRFDHLKTLAPKFQTVMEKLPEAKVDDSRTTEVHAGTSTDVKVGEVIATAVGFEKGLDGSAGPNVGFDFGYYDKKHLNEASQNPEWAALHEDEKDQAYYAVCWLDLLPVADAALLRNLPGADSTSGKTSDYCK